MMSNNRTYYLHFEQGDWNVTEISEIHKYFIGLGYRHSEDAAIGEGAGGPGWETIIEVVFTISSVASLCEQIWRLSKFLIHKKPRKKAPKGNAEIFRLVVHYSNTIISIDLLDSEKNIEAAIKKMNKVNFSEPSRIFQIKDDIEVY